ncbi:MAG: DUF4041 domain-containing protein [Planctomycetota bacterium]
MIDSNGTALPTPSSHDSANYASRNSSSTSPGDKSTSVDKDERRIVVLEAEVTALRSQIEAAAGAGEVVTLSDEQMLQEVGIYRYHHPLETSVEYKTRLHQLSMRISEILKTKRAIKLSNMFTYDNSLAKGKKMSGDLSKLMLRAYNAEVDNALRTLRAGNVVTAKKRVEASRSAIRRLGRMMQMQISERYHELRIEEIELTADFLMKKQQEREEAREERARLREQKKVEAEIAAERDKLDKERSHLVNTLEALRANGASNAELERRLAAVDEAIAQNDFRAANVRAGYIYVISNRGAFGANVVKIGLTRRLEPLERINELSSASVPFRFDVHAIYFSEDAVTLESELHAEFADRRVNCANLRKEFFFASPIEVQNALVLKVGNLLEFNEIAESADYLQSIRYWPKEHREARRAVTGTQSGNE